MLYAPLEHAVHDPNGVLVGTLINTVASEQDADLDLVVAAMWDLVESGKLSYGTNGRVRRASGAPA
jgi:hypothetical protein